MVLGYEQDPCELLGCHGLDHRKRSVVRNQAQEKDMI